MTTPSVEEHVPFHAGLPVRELVAAAKEVLGATAILEERTGLDRFETVIGVSDGRYAASRTLCFVDRAPGPEAVERLREVFVITNRQISPALEGCPMLVVDDPRALFIDLITRIAGENGFSPFTSLLKTSPYIHPEAEIHPNAIVEEGVSVGAGARIAAGCVLKRGTCVSANVVVRETTVIGCDGMGLYRALDGRLLKFPHLAGVMIEEGAEIGASCVLARGVLTSTRIGKETVIGNRSSVGHAARIGDSAWVSVGCLVGGNSRIGDRSTLGMGVCMRDNISVGRNCSIGMGSVVMKDLPDESQVLGNPARRLPAVNAGPRR